MHIGYFFHNLIFKKPSKTSRGTLFEKRSWFITVKTRDTIAAIGECGVLEGLSHDNPNNYEEKLKWVCHNFNNDEHVLWEVLKDYPSIQFGIEQAKLAMKNTHTLELFPSEFTTGKRHITINGLIWMNDIATMKREIAQKLDKGFKCLKLKVGALNFEDEIQLIKTLRRDFSEKTLEIRLDANGAFAETKALEILKRLSELNIHSIEQPIKAGKHAAMATLCEKSPVAIALDEELIGVLSLEAKKQLLNLIKPKYIIIKPSLIGGFRGSDEWIALAGEQNVGWWITSALESNIGLNAIAQYTFMKNNPMPQGLGTGELYTNNIPCPLWLYGDKLCYKPYFCWDFSNLNIPKD